MSDEPEEGGGSGHAVGGRTARDAAADVADAVTLVARAAGSALDRVGEIAGDLLSGLAGGDRTGAAALESDVIPEMPPLFPVAPGGHVETRVRLVNREDAASEPFELSVTDMVSEARDRIPAAALSVAKHQRVVAAHGSDTVLVTVAVPPDAKPGSYRGELHPSDASVLPATIAIDVR
jgi:hypothetical protein